MGTPYITVDRLNQEMAKLDAEWAELPGPGYETFFTIIDLKGVDLTQGVITPVTGIYSALDATVKPCIFKNYKQEGAEGPAYLGTPQKKDYTDGGVTKHVYETKGTVGILYVFENDNIFWLKRWIPASSYISSFTIKKNAAKTPSTNIQYLYKIDLVWDSTKCGDLTKFFKYLDIALIYQKNIANTWHCVAQTVTSTGIVLYVVDLPVEPASFRLADCNLYLGSVAF